MRRVILYYPNCTIEGYMNSRGEFADKDGVLITMTTDPDTIKMENLELPDVPFTGSKYIGTKQQMLEVMKEQNQPELQQVVKSPVGKLNYSDAEIAAKPVHDLAEEEVEEEEREEEPEVEVLEKDENEAWVDMTMSDEDRALLESLLFGSTAIPEEEMP